MCASDGCASLLDPRQLLHGEATLYQSSKVGLAVHDEDLSSHDLIVSFAWTSAEALVRDGGCSGSPRGAPGLLEITAAVEPK